MQLQGVQSVSPASDFSHCRMCGHQCGVDRSRALGYCQLDDQLRIAAICRHHGEEPALGGPGGVCNVFLAHCTMQCLYCQNYQISDNRLLCTSHRISLDEAVRRIAEHVRNGCTTVGFVSPTSQVPWVLRIIEGLWVQNLRPVVVYNTGAYDEPSTIAILRGYVDVYLPDYKYGSYDLAQSLSGVRNYPDYALDSIAAMVDQVGTTLQLDAEGIARRGLIVRHLVLPGQAENTRSALLNLQMEFGRELTISLLGQYTPTSRVHGHPFLSASLRAEEYEQAVDFMLSLGFHHGWTQGLESAGQYTPDFSQRDPFASIR